MAGRPHKGDRHVMVTRAPREVADSVMDHASRQGVSISEYIATALAEHEGLSHLAPVKNLPQERLPIRS